MLSGRSSSTAPMSLENRFKILPEVLTLKNLMVAPMTLLKRLLCSVMEDRMHIL